ncbi:MAG: DHA2 family efflux MFS transporter permease subunit [Alphaproteobacteria bacterium]|nr:DHA2 family efflux MFS transporter permease subunit [Alphaproteobacteria bacterium]
MARDSVEDLFHRYGPGYRWFVTIAGLTASFTMVLTGTIVNVAIPDVMGAYGVGQDKAQFLSTAFITTMTASQLLNAWFVGKLGQRNAFIVVLLIFTLGGLICGFSPNLDLIIFGRVMQGFAAGIVQPLVMVTLFQVFPADRRGTAMAIYGMGLVLALGFGPVVGGVTIDLLGWRNIFFVPLPLVAIALTLGFFLMPSARTQRQTGPFDWYGYVLLCIALFCLMTAIGHGQRDGWTSDRSVTVMLIGGAATIGFVISQLRPGSGMLDFTLFKNARFSAAVLVAIVFGMGNFASTYAIPVFGQIVQNYTATVAGFLMLPASLFVVAALPLTGRMTDRMSPQFPIMGGLIVFALGSFLLSRADVNTSFWTFALYAAVARFGMSFITPALMATALSSLPPDRLNQGSGTINFFRQLGGAIGINALVVVLELRTQFHSDAFTTTQTASNSATRELLTRLEGVLTEAGVAAPQVAPMALHHLGRVVEAQASTMGFQDGFIVTSVVFLLALIPAYILARAAPDRKKP